MRFSVGRPIPLVHTFETADGEPFEPAADVTVTVTRQGAPAPTITSNTENLGGGTYAFTAYGLPQGVYTVRWSGGSYADVWQLELTGGDLFSIREFRASHRNLSDAVKYRGADIIRVRNLVAQEFQVITGRSFVPRTERSEWTSGDYLPQLDVESASIVEDGGTLVPLVLDRIEMFAFADGVRAGTYTVELDYGFRYTPEDIKNVAILRARTLLFEKDSGIPDRATSFQPGEGGTYILSTPGRRGATTGIPDVDAVLARYTLAIEDSIGGMW